MGKRRAHQDGLWVVAAELPKSPGHPFYRAVNRILDSNEFDAFVEKQCRPFYAAEVGRPSLTPGRYFRLQLLGYYEGLDSERGMAWRAADSLGVRAFLGLGLDETAPDHSTISRTRRRIDVETHHAVFTWVLSRIAEAGLVSGKTLGVDATTLEANAAMRSIVRRDTGESYVEFLTGLAKESGIETPTREALARLDRRRKKKTSNLDWTSPADPDARVTKMKDGRTHLAHKAEHAVDMESGAVVAVTLQGADQGDTATIAQTLAEAASNVAAVKDATVEGTVHAAAPAEVVADKGYHSDEIMVTLAELDLRSYVAEPDRGQRVWEGDTEAQKAVYGNRRRIRGARGRRLQRSRGEMVERTFAHVYDTGGMRRTHLRGHSNILKRLLIHVGAFNLGLLLRSTFGVGTPRGCQGRSQPLVEGLSASLRDFWPLLVPARLVRAHARLASCWSVRLADGVHPLAAA